MVYARYIDDLSSRAHPDSTINYQYATLHNTLRMMRVKAALLLALEVSCQAYREPDPLAGYIESRRISRVAPRAPAPSAQRTNITTLVPAANSRVKRASVTLYASPPCARISLSSSSLPLSRAAKYEDPRTCLPSRSLSNPPPSFRVCLLRVHHESHSRD